MLKRSLLVRYGFALASVILTTYLRVGLASVVQNRFPLALAFCAVIASSYFGGRGPGLLSVALGSIATCYFVLPPTLTFTGKAPGTVSQIVVFAFISGFIAVLSGSLRIANDAIQDRETQLRFMAAAMPEILFTADSTGLIESLSERFHEFSGKTLTQLSALGWLDLVHKDDSARAQAAWKASVAQRVEFQETCRLRRKDGAYRWFQCRAVPMLDKQRRIVRWFGVCVDIDDRKHLEEALAGQTRALVQSNEDLQRFVFAASHDLQEPLKMIGIFSELLIRNQPEKAESAYLVAQIRRGVGRMHDLIQASLEFSHIRNESTENLAVINLEDSLSDALWSLQSAIEEAAATIIRDPLPEAVADSRMISRVFQNLIGNAVKFRGTAPPVIKITGSKNADECMIAVSDNGIGMAMNDAEKVFEAFRRLHLKSQYPGSGLGLASVKRIIEMHHGRVWVESEPGKGSTFFFTLPSKV